MMIVSAAVSVMPCPPALVESRNANVLLPPAWKRSIAAWRSCPACALLLSCGYMALRHAQLREGRVSTTERARTRSLSKEKERGTR